MGKIRQAQTPPGPIRILFDELKRLHREAGEPSMRTLASKISVSHTTVHAAVRGPIVPRWPILELVVEQLGGDTASIKQLWLAARKTEDELDSRQSNHEPAPSDIIGPEMRTSRRRVRGGDETAVVAIGGSGNEVLISYADRIAMIALFRGYFGTPSTSPHPHPLSYAEAAASLGWPKSTLIKRIEYLRLRLKNAGVADLSGPYATHHLAQLAISRNLITREEVDQFEKERKDPR
ncbi:hypothetical protein [Micromonospora echinospora]|uniref:hypothetical protein n=1 Tax=Micromonospora echinospora TaxID=1877 RepID=UPI003A874553